MCIFNLWQHKNRQNSGVLTWMKTCGKIPPDLVPLPRVLFCFPSLLTHLTAILPISHTVMGSLQFPSLLGQTNQEHVMPSQASCTTTTIIQGPKALSCSSRTSIKPGSAELMGLMAVCKEHGKEGKGLFFTQVSARPINTCALLAGWRERVATDSFLPH